MAGAKIGFHPRRRESTPEAPGIGAGEIRLRRALKAAADLPRFTGSAGPGLIHGLPPLVTTAIWLACAKPPIMSNPWTASYFVTVFIQQCYIENPLSATVKGLALRTTICCGWGLLRGLNFARPIGCSVI